MKNFPQCFFTRMFTITTCCWHGGMTVTFTNITTQTIVNLSQSLACEVAQAQLPQAEVSITSVVEKNSKGVPVLVELVSTDDPQVLQGQVVELVQSHQHVACHLSDRLQTHK